MVDQQANSNTRSGADPKGVDAALAAGNNDARRGDSAASAAQAFNEGARQRDEQYRTGQADVRGSGVHMMATVGSIGDSAVGATHDVLRSAIGASEDLASGLIGGAGHVAADLVHGVRDLGYEVRDGATGLIGAVGAVGGSAVHTVAGLLVDVVDGVRHVLGAAVAPRPNGHAPLAAEREDLPPARPPSVPAGRDSAQQRP